MASKNAIPTTEKLVFDSVTDATDPRTVWKLLEAFTDTIEVVITPEDGLFVQVRDRACSSLCQWTMMPYQFTEFNIKQTHSFGITIPIMVGIMAAAGNGATVCWDFSSGDENICITATGGKGIDLTVMMRTVEIDQSTLNIPEEDWTGKTISTVETQKTVSKLISLQRDISCVRIDHVGDDIEVTVKSDMSTASARVSVIREDEDESNTSESDGDGDDIHDDGTPKRPAYQAKLLGKILDVGVKLSDQLKVSLKRDLPMSLVFIDSSLKKESPSRSTNFGEFRIFIAPTISDY